MLIYETLLLKYYPQFSENYVVYKIPMMQGWARIAAAIELDSTISCERDGKGYVAMEIDRLIKIAVQEYERKEAIGQNRT